MTDQYSLEKFKDIFIPKDGGAGKRDSGKEESECIIRMILLKKSV